MNSKVEDGEDSDMEDMRIWKRKMGDRGQRRVDPCTGDQQDISSVCKTTKNGAQCIEDQNSGGSSELCVKRGKCSDFWDLTVPVRPQRFGCWQR